MKKLIRDPQTVVQDALAGVAAAHPGLVRVQGDPPFIVRSDAPVRGKVGLVSGGGSGHEPLHGGFVGFGMLDAAVPGAVFTSPTPAPRASTSRTTRSRSASASTANRAGSGSSGSRSTGSSGGCSSRSSRTSRSRPATTSCCS